MKVKTYKVPSKSGQIPHQVKMFWAQHTNFHQAAKESQSSMSLKQLIMLLQLTVLLMKLKILILIMLILITSISLKLDITLSKLEITLKILKFPDCGIGHVWLKNLWKLPRVINSKYFVANLLNLTTLKMLNWTLNVPLIALLNMVTSLMFQKKSKDTCKKKDLTSTNKGNRTRWTSNNTSKYLTFLNNGKLWSSKELRRNYLRLMSDLWRIY